MKAFLVTCDATKERLPVAKNILLESFNENSIQVIYSFDATRLDIINLSTIDPSIWKERITEIHPILIDNASAANGCIHNDESFVQRFKDLILYKSDYQQIANLQWLQPRNLSPGEISVLFKHYCAILHISEGKETHGLIVEDDILNHSETKSLFDNLLDFIQQEEPDYIDIAGGAGLHIPAIKHNSKLFSRINPPRTRTNAGYILSKRLAQLLAENFFPLVFPIDWHLQFFLYKFTNLPLNCYWMNNTVYLHGSETPTYSSWRQ